MLALKNYKLYFLEEHVFSINKACPQTFVILCFVVEKSRRRVVVFVTVQVRC